MASSDKHKIALVLSGGVSAGAYIAGALDELICAFNQSDEFEIDVIAGGSAGATTGALIAHGLLYRNGDARLRETWVEAVDLFRMLAPEAKPTDQVTLLNGEVLEQIADDAIAWPEGSGGVQKRARCCAPELQLAMTISNCTALPYISKVQVPTASGPKDFVQFRNAEQQMFRLQAEQPRAQELWQRITRVARASSAIPFVFPRVRLFRDPALVPASDGPETHFIHQPNVSEAQWYWYYDGGTYNNLPIGLAAYASGNADEKADPKPTRTLIVINPWDTPSHATTAPDAPPDLLDFGLRLVAGIRNEASTIQFQDDDAPLPEVSYALPGVPMPPVGLLGQVRMITPAPGSATLRCTRLGHLSAFLDQEFREYDFRRGAADARIMLNSIDVQPTCDRDDARFYTPDDDPRFPRLDLSTYEALADVKSSNSAFAGRSLKSVLEEHVEQRTDHLLAALDKRVDVPHVPDVLIRAYLDRKIKPAELLPRLW